MLQTSYPIWILFTDHGLAIHKVLQDSEHIKMLGIIWNP